MPPIANRVDYNEISSTYDRRYIADRLMGVEAALVALIREHNVEYALEVGCGTGRWLQGLRTSKIKLSGLDPSTGMLKEAQNLNLPCDLICGRAEQLPFPDATFDLIFCVNALHHFEDPYAFTNQVTRVLRPGGLLVVVGQVPQDRRNRWYVYDYFEGTYETDLARFQTWGTVLDWLVTQGYTRITWQPLEWIRDHKCGREVLDDPFLMKGATSQLALLSDQAYKAGIQRIEAALTQAEKKGEPIVFKAELRLDMFIGYKHSIQY
jgi:ubiquinone/menaquinone biosynthesis C-methylase UbiE